MVGLFFAGPHTGAQPYPVSTLLDWQDTLVPPGGVQVQRHGPVPVTAEAFPTAHSNDGAGYPDIPFAGPHWPGRTVTVLGALQAAICPPDAQFQLHGPTPVTEDAVPTLHRPPDGVTAVATPCAGPQDGGGETPIIGAEQDAALPPPVPEQVQPHAIPALTVEGVPVLHRPTIGLAEAATPCAEPHTPSTGGLSTRA